MAWFSWYKKPEYRDIKAYSTEVRDGKRSLSPDGRSSKRAIPKRLKLENILKNKTCSPMSLYDFHMYLKYIEFSAENLEFYIWYKNYTKAYIQAARENGLDGEDGGPAYSYIIGDDILADSEQGGNEGCESTIDLDPEMAKETLDKITDLLNVAPRCREKSCDSSRSDLEANVSSSEKGENQQIPSQSRARMEIEAVIQTFLLPESPKELNIPPPMRDQALLGLQTSCNPIHLLPIAEHVFQLLRNCSHRNFVRLGVSNGTMETICMATGLGIVLTFSGFLFVLLRAFVPFMASHSRWNAFGAWPFWFLGMSLILSGTRGSCFFLLLFSRRQPLPWERFDDSASMLTQKTGIMKLVSRLMILDRKIRVKDIHLRRLQNKIVIQSLIGGVVFATAGVLLFIFLPVWADSLT